MKCLLFAYLTSSSGNGKLIIIKKSVRKAQRAAIKLIVFVCAIRLPFLRCNGDSLSFPYRKLIAIALFVVAYLISLFFHKIFIVNLAGFTFLIVEFIMCALLLEMVNRDEFFGWNQMERWKAFQAFQWSSKEERGSRFDKEATIKQLIHDILINNQHCAVMFYICVQRP